MRLVLNLKIEWMLRKKRNLQTTLRVNGVIFDAVTITGLARILGKSKDTILRYESLDIFPLAPVMKGNVRYYPISLARRLVPLVNRFPCNRTPNAELIVEVNKLFKEEKNKLLCQQK